MANLSKLARVVSYAKRYTARIEEEFRRRTRRAAEVIRAEVRANISTAGGGRASKPGQYPRRQDGGLVRGVKTTMSKSSPYTFRVVNTAPYAGFLEYGTAGGKVIKPVHARALSWRVWAGKSKSRVFATRVTMGAIRDRSFMRRTLAECRAKIRAIYLRGMGQGARANTVLRIG